MAGVRKTCWTAEKPSNASTGHLHNVTHSVFVEVVGTTQPNLTPRFDRAPNRFPGARTWQDLISCKTWPTGGRTYPTGADGQQAGPSCSGQSPNRMDGVPQADGKRLCLFFS